MKELHLITKLIFDTEYFYPERFLKIITGDYASNALIVDVDEEELTVVNITPTLTEEGYKNTPQVSVIHSRQVAEGEIELVFPEEHADISEKLDKLYVSFRDVSTQLCEKEHFIAEKSKVKDQDDIDRRHAERMESFQHDINILREKGA